MFPYNLHDEDCACEECTAIRRDTMSRQDSPHTCDITDDCIVSDDEDDDE